jgi:glucan phosphoethanolaminetransferase (alkaline phosphatase superfamily)
MMAEESEKKEKKEKVRNCGDEWERFSSSISSLSLSLLPTLLFVLIMSYIIVVGLQNADITFTVQGQEVTITYPQINIPVDYSAIKNAVIYLFAAILIGIPVPLLSGKWKPLKILVSLIQAGAFVYGLYIFVMMIINFASALM